MHLSHMGQCLAFEFSVNSTGSACEESDWHTLCWASAVTGRAVSEGLPALRDAAHLKTHPTSRKGCQQWESSHRAALTVGSGEHSVPVLCHAWLLTRLQDTDLGPSPDGCIEVSGICLMLFASHWCMNRPQGAVPEVEFYFFILSFNPRLVAHLTDGFPDLSEQLS